MKKPSAEQAGSVRYELERARDNLQQRYLNNDDQSAGRSSRAIFSALCLLDTYEAANKQENVDAARSEHPPAAAGGGALDARTLEDACEHTWSEWEPVLGGRGYHVERKCTKCGKEQYDD